MLSLTRNSGQSLYIGDDIKVTILGVQGNQVRIGIQAPPDKVILRQEIMHQPTKKSGGAGGNHQ